MLTKNFLPALPLAVSIASVCKTQKTTRIQKDDLVPNSETSAMKFGSSFWSGPFAYAVQNQNDSILGGRNLFAFELLKFRGWNAAAAERKNRCEVSILTTRAL